ncbi:uncharacterized protein LOC141834681 isoform X2 [Curcuma longa]|uniref:uncharacterized protein LOC141834681 isoform X2 n=1 Tax=Curcuma longa TaxID=136217 RepID=UPI003D9F484D
MLSSSVIAGQIRFLLQSVNDFNFDSTRRELFQLVECGSEVSTFLLQTCLDQILVKDGDIPPLKKDLVSAVVRYLLDKPHFSTNLSGALSSISINESFLEDISNTLGMSVAEKIGVGLGLLDSNNPDLKMRGQNFCIAQIEELCANPSSTLHTEQIHDIVMFLYRTEGLSKHMDSFTRILSLLQLKGRSFFLSAPLLTNESKVVNNFRHLELFSGCFDNDFDAALAEIEKEISMADIVAELGYGCTIDISHCKEILSQFQPLNEETISKLIGIIACNHSNLEDPLNVTATFCSALGSCLASDSSLLNTWNVNVLVETIKELAPKTNWALVLEKLDHEGFVIPDETAFSLLMSIYKSACQDPFPLHAICGSAWKNAEGQLSFLRYAVSAPPEVFTFEHCSRQLINSDLEHLKNGNQAWFCLDLLEILCQLAESGHASLVRVILDYPLSQYPEVLLIGVAHISTSYNLIQYEVSSTLFHVILKDPSKSSTLAHLWNINPNLVLRGFIESSTDPKILFRIVDLCDDLKILSLVLAATPFPFSIRLAAVASRKDHINLENWLNEYLTAYKDAFFEDCLRFLKEALGDATADIPDVSLPQSQSTILNEYRETCSIFFKVLQAHSGQFISNQHFEEIKKLHISSNPRIPTVEPLVPTVSEGVSDDIDAEVNTYFHQMFSGQLTIDAMIQMLAHFKESSDPREQKIFECIIHNLFEEYKFFPKYPERQLKIVAVLFGSLIKHELVTHLALGSALRGVIHALRKSVDSKMFMFGSNAIEQFTDRLVEWPSYCNHILQISHLRGTHAELVSFIERALTKISSSQSESNSGNPISIDLQSSGAPSTETMEASESSWQMMGSASTHLGQQFSSLQLQQRHQGFLGERSKVSAMYATHTKPPLSHAGQSSFLSGSAESFANQKITSHHSVATAALATSSPNFLRSRGATASGFGAALNIETLVAAAERRDTPIEIPPSEIQDKILFMINNISTSNMEAKAKEFSEVLNEQYYPWFAQYMVMKRASIEPNFHDLYLKFLDKVNSKALNKEIVKATYENCKVLLRSDLIKSSSEERSLLKNLGSWLGKFTIGRNQALRAKEIDPKALIIEAYEKGLMIAVIPFTSKILEPCHSSLAYQPPNPWTMGILSLLSEIYNLPNLKMNLKFDIEVLFKNLSVDMKEVKPTTLLIDKIREVEGNPDFSNKDITAAHPPLVEINSGLLPPSSHVELQTEVKSSSDPGSHPNAMAQYTSAPHITSGSILEEDKIGIVNGPELVSSVQGLTQVTPSPSPSPSPFSLNELLTIIPNSESYININPKLSSMGSNMQFHRIIQLAMDRAIREIVSPVIQRSVTIASRTTKELVLKDYSMETDDGVISRSAHLMVGTLAGSLAHVTCKEPLRVALSSNLRGLLQVLNVANDHVEQIVQILTTDHLDLGCAVIENVASEKAVELIDGEMAPAFAAMRKQREASGSAYFDTVSYAQGPLSRIPEALRPKPGRLSIAQQRVYDDFIKNIWQNQSGQNSTASSLGLSGVGSSVGNSSLSRVYGASSGSISPNVYVTSQVAPVSMTQPLDLTLEESDRGLAQLPSVSLTYGADDNLTQHGGEVSSMVASVTSADLHMVDPAVATKDSTNVSAPSPSPGMDHLGAVLPESLLSTGEALEKYLQVAQKLEAMIAADAGDTEIQGVVAEVPEIILKCEIRDEASLAIAQKVFKSLYENASNTLHIASHLAILAAIRDVCKLVVKELTSWVIYSDEERKFNKEITVGLIRSELLNLAEYDVHLAKLIGGGKNKPATEFAISLVQTLAFQESGVSMSELYSLIEALSKLAMKPGSLESLQQLVEIAKSNVISPSLSLNKEEKIRQFKDKKGLSGVSLTNREELDSNDPSPADPAGFYEQIATYFADWCRICELPTTNESTYSHYVSQLQQNGLLKGDDITDRFFLVFTELAVTYCKVVHEQTQLLSFFSIDSYAKFVVLVLKYCSMDPGSTKSLLLPKILSVTVRTIQKDAEEKKISFNPRPYFRLFISWLLDLITPDTVDSVNFQVLTSFANAFHALQPLKVPGWSFAWLELVSHRSFMPKLLTCNGPKGWPFFQRLLVDLLKFMEPYLRNVELSEPVQLLYKGTLRVLLVLLHDFPDFLCDYHFSFCDVIPSSCIQMRNVILSAFPRNMRLPDPSTPNLKIDLLPEISQPPRILSDVDSILKAKQIKADIDEHLKTSEVSSFISQLIPKLLLSQSEANLAGTRYDVPLINSLVLYIGMQATQLLQNKSTASVQQVNHNGPLDLYLVNTPREIFQSLVNNLDSEGRYLLLNAIANQLRYPNNHTHYFSFVLLYLFAESKQNSSIQEQITQVLLERMIVNRPHPWGLLITFIELIRNQRYDFWNCSFTRCTPEIEKLFESVSRTCVGPKAMNDSMVSGSI